jgi:VIT1/CCC1 family predicted Fe2+/Mn2+ transporter
MNTGRDEEIAASVGAYRDLGPAYDDAVSAGLVERIGAEIDRRVDERVSQYQRGGEPAAGYAGSQQAPHRPAVRRSGQISWQQAILAFCSMVIGAITSGIIAAHGSGTWTILVIWIAIVILNMAIFRSGRPFRDDRRFPD